MSADSNVQDNNQQLAFTVDQATHTIQVSGPSEKAYGLRKVRFWPSTQFYFFLQVPLRTIEVVFFYLYGSDSAATLNAVRCFPSIKNKMKKRRLFILFHVFYIFYLSFDNFSRQRVKIKFVKWRYLVSR